MNMRSSCCLRVSFVDLSQIGSGHRPNKAETQHESFYFSSQRGSTSKMLGLPSTARSPNIQQQYADSSAGLDRGGMRGAYDEAVGRGKRAHHRGILKGKRIGPELAIDSRQLRA